MKRHLCTALLAIGGLLMSLPTAALSADAPAILAPDAPTPALVAGQQITWSFADLPTTLRGMIEDKTEVPLATVHLPADYTPERNFPAALFIGGAQGGTGGNAGFAREIVGENGYICIGLPSFKQSIEPLKEDKSNYWMRMMIHREEGSYIWRHYRVMLERIYSTVPNIDRQRSVFGGFSNGAHTAAVLLSNAEEGQALLTYFRRFALIEGGHRLQPAVDLTGIEFIIMRGAKREVDLFRNAKPALDAAKATWTEFVMPDVEHEYSPEGKAQTRAWIEAKP